MGVSNTRIHYKLLGIAFIMFLALGVLGATVAYAEESEGYIAGDAGAVKPLPEWAIDKTKVTGSSFTTQADLPAQFDLRKDLGKSRVTSVKDQTPWNTCWAFSGIAAAESSLISDLGKDPAEVNLSEKHLIWYASHPVTEEEAGEQAGEGVIYFTDPTLPATDFANINASYGFANPIFVTTLFSSGVGPVSEVSFPYKGKDGVTEYQWMLKHPDEWKANHKRDLMKTFVSDEELLATIKKTGKGNSIDEYLQGAYERVIQRYKDGANTDEYKENAFIDGYSVHDDWSIPEKNERGDSNRMLYEGYTLRDGNTLPVFHTFDLFGRIHLNDSGTQAAKQELLAGHAISVAYNSNSKYLNQENWAHYTSDSTTMTHGVTIVGWNDDYSKENFKKATDPENVSAIPPANGAWLVKNSWGTSAALAEIANSDGTKTHPGKSNWGIDGSGYFWISYYDRSLGMAETLKFDDDLADEALVVNQYDYMPASEGFYQEESFDVISTANVFTTDYAQQLKSISTRTVVPNTTVTFAVYRLKKDSKTPTDGTLVETFTNKFPLAGYHRLNISKKIYLHENERFSVVSTAHAPNTHGNELYWASSNTSISKNDAEQQRAKGMNKQYYGVGIINKNESFIYKGGSWTDWSDYVKDSAYAINAQSSNAGKVSDNFSIKAYSLLWKEDAQKSHKHVWDDGKVTTAPTETKEGVATYTCTECGETKTEPVAKEAAKEIISKAEKKVIATKVGNDPKNGEFAPLKVTTKRIAKDMIVLRWEKIKNAASYVVYGSECEKNSTMSKCATVKLSPAARIFEVNGKDLKEGTYYKFIVIALNDKGKAITTSDSVFVTTEGGKKSNPTGITVKPTTVKVKIGDTKNLTVKVKGEFKEYMDVRFESSNEEVARVNNKGVVKGIKKGTCKVYAYAQNGIAKTVNVTVTK